MARRSDVRLRAIATARDCAALGAKLQTTQMLSGLSEIQLHQLFSEHDDWSNQGRAPDSAEWYFRATLPNQIEASMLMSLFVRLRSAGFEAPQALIGAYQHYRQTFSHARICFNRAFELGAHVEGRWLARVPLLTVLACRHCGNRYLAAAGTWESSPKACPFCRMRRRCDLDLRIRAAFQLNSSPERVRMRLQGLRGFLNRLGVHFSSSDQGEQGEVDDLAARESKH
jgi:flagellar transcriptional activator FlhC